MDQQLYKYLVLHRNLSIPQLGSFLIKDQPAHYENATGLLHAPQPLIYFSEGVTSMSEKLFFDFLSVEMGVDEVAAIKQFHDYAYRLRENLLTSRVAEVKGIGTLIKGNDDLIVFNPANDLNYLLPPVQQGEAISADIYATDEETDTIASKDNWWVYAIILTILGLGALLYYYS